MLAGGPLSTLLADLQALAEASHKSNEGHALSLNELERLNAISTRVAKQDPFEPLTLEAKRIIEHAREILGLME